MFKCYSFSSCSAAASESDRAAEGEDRIGREATQQTQRGQRARRLQDTAHG